MPSSISPPLQKPRLPWSPSMAAISKRHCASNSGATRAGRLGIKSKMQHVAVGDDVILAFQAELAQLPRTGLALARHIIGIGDGFGADEALLEIGVDHTRCLWRAAALGHRPGMGFLGAHGEEI